MSNAGKGASGRSKCARASAEQLMHLVDYMAANKKFALGRHKESHNLWDNLAMSLNNLPGANKTPLEWKKCWADTRSNTRSRLAKAREARGSAGNALVPLDLSELDQKVLSVVGVESSLGLPIEESGYGMIGQSEFLPRHRMVDARKSPVSTRNETSSEPGTSASTPQYRPILPKRSFESSLDPLATLTDEVLLSAGTSASTPQDNSSTPPKRSLETSLDPLATLTDEVLLSAGSSASTPQYNSSRPPQRSCESSLDQATLTNEVLLSAGTSASAPQYNRSRSRKRSFKSSLDQAIVTDELLLSVIKHFKRPVQQDDCFDIFGKNVAMKLRSLPKPQRLIAEKIINETLFEAEMGILTMSHKLTS